MSDRETELLQKWHSEKASYDAWGKYVCDVVRSSVALVIDMEIDVFLRIPITYRTKTDGSLLAKAFYRPEKIYANPYDQIEDKVGVRVVVLSTEDNRTVESAVISRTDVWIAEKSRDYELERSAKPYEFNYQSLHYVLRATADFNFNGVNIFAGSPCELQIRTLLQHAYSELTHDTIYKPSVAAEPDVKRAAAKSMALIEATDDYFTQVRARIKLATAPAYNIDRITKIEYSARVGSDIELTSLNDLIIDFYRKWFNNDFDQELATFLQEKPFIEERVRERARISLLFRQPAILLVYLAVTKRRRDAARQSPLSPDELAPIYSDLGFVSPR